MQNKEADHYKIPRRNSTNSLESLEDMEETDDNAQELKKKNRMSLKIDPEMMKESRRKSGTSVSKKMVKDGNHQKKVIKLVKVYSISNCSSRERLRQKIAKSKLSQSVIIDWDKILSCKE